MSIVTISRGLFSSGQALAERAAEILGYRSMSRELLLEAATRYEIPEAKLTELMETPPEVTPIKPELLRLYRVVMQAAMCEVVQGGKIVYHGHGGQEFLPGIHHVLKVRLLAPLTYRVARVREQRQMDQASAYLYIARVDDIRARRVQEFFGVDWQDPRRYDLLLNLGQMSLEDAAQRVAESAKRPEFQPTPASEQALQDLTVKARVEASLGSERGDPVGHPEYPCAAGHRVRLGRTARLWPGARSHTGDRKRRGGTGHCPRFPRGIGKSERR